jgi:hypothetical protein
MELTENNNKSEPLLTNNSMALTVASTGPLPVDSDETSIFPSKKTTFDFGGSPVSEL